jgi:4-hydroxybenzoate polyprenyltransferase
MGAWAAIRGSLFTYEDLPAWLLLTIVTLWIGGFDIIYACQDVKFDRRMGLQSIPAKFGIPFALRLSSICHIITILLLLGLGLLLGFGWLYWIGMIVIIALLVWEHLLVHPDDLSKINIAFFNINGYISITLFLSILGSIYLT